ncbi:general substrate transporter [Mycena sp. CBHHK59/15]|nr:general substrate transporter [Mycena sp. CBHHK59/15]
MTEIPLPTTIEGFIWPLAQLLCLLCAIFASIGGLSFGYDQGVVHCQCLVMHDFLLRWPVTPLQKGALTAVLELGALIGALSSGVLADKYSRRHSIFVACVRSIDPPLIFNIGALFQCLAQNLGHLFIGRAVGGVGVGALSMLSPLYISEISPPEVRGSLVALEQFSIVLGVVVGFWIGFFTRDMPNSLSWRIPLGLQIAPGVILALGSLLLLPASPRLLVLKGQYDEAESSLAKLRGRDNGLTKIELLEMRIEATLINHASASEIQSKSGLARELASWGKLFRKKYRDRTMVAGINALLYYGPTLVRSIGVQGDKVALIVSGGIGIVQFIAVGPAVVWIDRLGRKPLLRGTRCAIMASSHLIIAILVQQYQSDWPSHSIAAWIAVTGIYIFTFSYGVSFGPVGWVLPSEVTASNWANNFLIGLITPVIMDGLLRAMNRSGTFLTFSSACFLAYLWSTYWIPETAGVSLEEMDQVFESEMGREDEALRRQVEEELGLGS